MTAIAFASCHGAPGVTTTVVGLAAAWPGARRPLVIEADPDGGVLAARFEDLHADRTLAEVAVDARRTYDHDRLLATARPLWGAVPVVVAPPSAEQAAAALATAGERLAAGLAASAEVVLVDVGRLTTRSPALPLARPAEMVVLVARAGFEDAASLAPRCAELRGAGCRPGLVVVGRSPYRPEELAESAQVELLGCLPADAAAAAVLAGGAGSDRRLRRSLLWRSLVDLAARLAAAAAVADPDQGSDDPVTATVAAALASSNGRTPHDASTPGAGR
jgi:MinD-like ATPase involved in chromosome partitioning or flagellar assembly